MAGVPAMLLPAWTSKRLQGVSTVLPADFLPADSLPVLSESVSKTLGGSQVGVPTRPVVTCQLAGGPTALLSRRTSGAEHSCSQLLPSGFTSTPSRSLSPIPSSPPSLLLSTILSLTSSLLVKVFVRSFSECSMRLPMVRRLPTRSSHLQSLMPLPVLSRLLMKVTSLCIEDTIPPGSNDVTPGLPSRAFSTSLLLVSAAWPEDAISGLLRRVPPTSEDSDGPPCTVQCMPIQGD